MTRLLLLEIGTEVASLPPITPPQPQPPSTWTPPPSSPVGLPPPNGLLVEPLADGAKLTWIPSVIPNTKTIVQAAANVDGSPSTWFDVTATADATYTVALPGGPVWVRLVAILNGIRSAPTAAAMASPISVAAIVDAAFDLDAKVAQEIVDRVQGDVDTAAAAAQALAEDKGLLLGMIDAVSAQVNDIIGADEWSIDKEYPEGDLTKSDGKLYRALQDVPAGTAITDIAYWQFIGNYDSLGDAVAATVGRANVLEIRVDANEDAIDTLGTRTSSLESVIEDPATGLTTKASIVDLDETNAHLDTLEGTVETHTDQISAANSAIAGKASQAALNATNTRVSATEGDITSQGSLIEQLQGDIEGKASTLALNALTDRVEETEEGISANSDAITEANAAIASKASSSAVSALSAAVDDLGDTVSSTTSSVALLTGTVNDQTSTITELAKITATAADTMALIPDAGFENPDLSENWQRDVNSTADPYAGIVLSSTTTPHTGKRCLRFYPDGGAARYAAMRTLIPVRVDEQYQMSFWTRVTLGPPAGEEIRCYIYFYDVDGTKLPATIGTGYVRPLDIPLANHNWTKHVAPPWTCPDGVAFVKLQLGVTGAVEPMNLYMDDLAFQMLSNIEAKFDASYSLAVNAGGKIAGLRLNSDGSTSSVRFLADEFSVESDSDEARFEWSDQNLRLYDDADVLRVRMGVWDD